MKRIKHRLNHVFIRFITLITALSLGFSSLACLTALAAPDDDEGPKNNTGITIYKNGVQYSTEQTKIRTAEPWPASTVTGGTEPVYKAPTVEEFNGGTDSVPIGDDEDLYCLTVDTGKSAGTAVQYFCVRYLDKNGARQAKYIFPHDDQTELIKKYFTGKGLKENIDLLVISHASLGTMGYSINEPGKDVGTLSSWARDELLFSTENPIDKVTGIEAFIDHGKWSLAGMAVSKVKSISGYREYGYYSGKYYFSLEKQPISRLKSKKNSPVAFSHANSSRFLNLGSRTSVYFSLTAVSEKETSSSGKKGAADLASPGDLYTFRLDFADAVGAGIESLLRRSADVSDPIRGTTLEDLALEVYYKNRDGLSVSVTMPVLLSAIGQYNDYAGTDKKVRTMGLCQMGDTIAFTGRLPELDSITRIRLHVGSAATDLLEKNCGLKMDPARAAEQAALTMKKDMANDPVTISGISVYKGTCRMSNTPDGTDTSLSENNKLQSYTVAYSFSEADPVLYCTTYDSSGFKIIPGSSREFELTPFTGSSGDQMIAAQRRENLLIRLRTNSVAGAEPTGSIKVQITSRDSSGVKNTTTYDMEAETLRFYGNWPSSKGAEDNFGYRYGTKPGGIVEFAVSRPDAAFVSDIVIMLETDSDEWQVSGVSVDSINSMGRRMIYAQKNLIVDDGYYSDYRIVRPVGTTQFLPFPVDVKLFFSPGDRISLSLDDNDPNTGAKADFFDVQQYMTYEQTTEDYGFATTCTTYDVDVKVADDPEVGYSNGDSGSVNQFYFQLDFSKGISSGYVLANQQLSADGFRSGCDEVFSVSVNRDYGDLTAVKIIPADVTTDSEVFDKLNIERITVTERRNASFSLQYVFENVGWIGIDYHDTSENNAVKIRKGRSWSELAKVCTDPVKQNVTNLLCEVTALPWEDIEFKGFTGSLCGEIDYIDTDDMPRTISFDVVSQMASYMNRAPKISAGKRDDLGALQNYFATVTDPDWMLRPNHIDRFFLPAIPDLKSLKTITFTGMARGAEPGYWVIGGLSIFTIDHDSGVIELAGNEIIRQMITSQFCFWEPETKETLSRQVLFPVGMGESVSFELSENTVEWKTDTVETQITKFPESYNDVMNVYLFPSEKSRKIDGVRVNIELNYYLRQSAKMYHLSQKNLYAYDSGKETAMFSYTGLQATGMKGLASMKVYCNDLNMMFDRAIVQQVREGVVICTYNISFGGASATLGLSKQPDSSTRIYGVTNNTKQKLLISFGTETKETILSPKGASNSVGTDVAVSLQYTSTLDRNGNSTYYTPYVYLTEQDITKIYPGMMAELPFGIPYLDKITGYRIVSFGSVDAKVEAAQAFNYYYAMDGSDSQFDMLCSFNQAYSVLTTPKLYTGVTNKDDKNAVTLVELDFDTAAAGQGSESGVSGAVRAVFEYKGQGGTARKTITDLSRYIQSPDKSFKTGETAKVRFFMPYCREMMNVSLSVPEKETWKLRSISGYYDYTDHRPVNRLVDKEIRSAPTEVNLTVVKFSTTISRYSAATKKTTQYGNVTNHLKEITCGYGDKITGRVSLGDNASAFTATAEVVNANGTTTALEFDQYDKNGFLFTVPDRPSTNISQYRITVWANENPYEKDVIEISVKPVNITLTTKVSRVDGGTSETHDLGAVTNGNMNITCLSGDTVTGTAAITDSKEGITITAVENSEKGSRELKDLIVDSDNNFSLTIPENNTSSEIVYTLTIASDEVEDLRDVINITVRPESNYLATKVTLTSPTGQKTDLGTVSGGKMDLNSESLYTVGGNVVVGRTDGGFDVRVRTMADGKVTDDTCTVSEQGFSYVIPGNYSGGTMTVTITVSPKNNPQLQDVISISVPPVTLRTQVTYVALDKDGGVAGLTRLGYVRNGEMEIIMDRSKEAVSEEYHFEVNYQASVSATVLEKGVEKNYKNFSLTDDIIFFRPPANNTTEAVTYTFVLTAEKADFKDVIKVIVPGRSYMLVSAVVTRDGSGEKQDVVWNSASSAGLWCEGGDRITGEARIYQSDNGYDITASVTNERTGKTTGADVIRNGDSFEYDIPDNMTNAVLRHELRFTPKDDPDNAKKITIRVDPTPAMTVNASVIKNNGASTEELGAVGDTAVTVWCNDGDVISGKVRVADSGGFDVRVEVTDQTTKEKSVISETGKTSDGFTYNVSGMTTTTHTFIHDIIITAKNNASAVKRIRVYVKGAEPRLTGSVIPQAKDGTYGDTVYIENAVTNVSAESGGLISGTFISNADDDVITSTISPDDDSTKGKFSPDSKGFAFRIPDIKPDEIARYTITVSTMSGVSRIIHVIVNAKG